MPTIGEKKGSACVSRLNDDVSTMFTENQSSGSTDPVMNKGMAFKNAQTHALVKQRQMLDALKKTPLAAQLPTPLFIGGLNGSTKSNPKGCNTVGVVSWMGIHRRGDGKRNRWCGYDYGKQSCHVSRRDALPTRFYMDCKTAFRATSKLQAHLESEIALEAEGPG